MRSNEFWSCSSFFFIIVDFRVSTLFKKRHRLPVHIGVKVAYALNERLSIESGLTYTRVASDMKDGTKRTTSQANKS